MTRFARCLAACCLAVMLVTTGAAAEVVTEVDYTVQEKLFKQLQAGSGFSGTLTVESAAAPGRESEALTTLKPLTFDCTYIYVRPDAATGAVAESRATLALVDGEKSLATAELALRSGNVYLASSLLGDGWFSLNGGTVTAAADGEQPAAGTIAQTARALLGQTAMPGLVSFAIGLLRRLHDVDTAKWSTDLETYTTKIDLWIEGYRQKAVLGKTDDGTTTMEVEYRIPAAAIKAQLKQMVMDLLTDEAFLSRLQTLLSDADVETFLNPGLQTYYFYAIDALPLEGELAIDRTVSLKGETLSLTLAMPLRDSQAGAMALRYDRHKGAGDLPDENTIELQSDSLLLRVAYQTYDTLTGTEVYQGTVLRQPLGTATFEVGAQDTAAAETLKTFSAGFTLSVGRSESVDAEGREAQAIQLALALLPDYTPDTAGDEATVPTDAQAAQYVVFEPLDLKLDATFASLQAKNAATSLDATLEYSGERAAQTVRLTFSGKTRGKWTPDALETDGAQALDTMDPTALNALLAQAGIKGGLLLLPYLSLPAAGATTEPSASITPDGSPAATPSPAAETSAP